MVGSGRLQVLSRVLGGSTYYEIQKLTQKGISLGRRRRAINTAADREIGIGAGQEQDIGQLETDRQAAFGCNGRRGRVEKGFIQG